MGGDWPKMKLREAKVALIDCDHRTPPAAEGGYPYVAIPQLRGGRVDLSEVRRIKREHYLEWTRKAVPSANDVILSRRCNPGETAVVPRDTEFALGQNLVLLRADGTKVYPPFLRWLARGPEWWEQISKFINVGAVFDSLRCADVPNFELRIPPFADQRAISRILDALDDKIELNRRMNETLESIARAIFKSWFVDFDPVRTKAEGRQPIRMDVDTAALFPDSFEQSGRAATPLGWRTRAVSEVCESIFSGGTPRTESARYWQGGIPWLSSGETRSKFIVSTERTITPAGVAESSTRLAGVGLTVVAGAGQGHTRGQTSMLFCEAYINQSVVALAADERHLSRTYLFFDLERRYEEFRQISDGHSSRGSLTTKLLGGIRIVVPERRVVEAFDTLAKPLTFRIAAALRENQSLAAFRDALLPKLLSGEVGVKQAEKNLAALTAASP